MKRKWVVVGTIGLLFIIIYWLRLRETKETSPGNAATRTGSPHISSRSPGSARELVPPESLNAANVTSQQVSSDKTDESQELAKIAELKADILIPYDQLKDDKGKQFRMGSAMRELAFMQKRQSIEALMDLLFAPEDQYFVSGTTPDGDDWYSVSHVAMIHLNMVLVGVPQPSNKRFYTAADLPAFRQWWNENKNKLEFKRLPLLPQFPPTR